MLAAPASARQGKACQLLEFTSGFVLVASAAVSSLCICIGCVLLLLLLLLLDQLVDCWISWSIAFPEIRNSPADAAIVRLSKRCHHRR